jgi:hypothetical protein
LVAAAIGTLDLVEWNSGAGRFGEMPFAAAQRGPGGTTAALLCLLAITVYLSRRQIWTLLVLPVIGHAALFIWQANESYTLNGMLGERGMALAESLTHWHLWVDLGTIALGVGISVAALVFETRPVPTEG